MDPLGTVEARPETRKIKNKYPFITKMVARFCVGSGLEIGPGNIPFCDPDRTEFLDKTAAGYGCPYPINIICDADHIPRPDAIYDYVVSSHCLEHLPNTLRTLKEWKRVLKEGGYLVLILPHGERTFDRGRAITTLQHHIKDYEENIGPGDLSHWPEFEDAYQAVWPHMAEPPSRRHYPATGTINRDWVMSQDHIHYHVWTQNEIVQVLQYLKMKIFYVADQCEDMSNSFLVIGQK